MDCPRLSPHSYDSAQKSPLFFSGAVVGASPHGPTGSCMYTNPQSIINTTSMVGPYWAHSLILCVLFVRGAQLEQELQSILSTF
jgi:hypothetical protein